MDEVHVRLVRSDVRDFLQGRQLHPGGISGITTLKSKIYNSNAKKIKCLLTALRKFPATNIMYNTSCNGLLVIKSKTVQTHCIKMK